MFPTKIAELFIEKANRLKRCSFIADGKSFSFRWSANYPDEISIPDFDEDALNAFLLTFRFFVQDNEPISLRRFCEDTLSSLPLPSEDIASILQVRANLNVFLDSQLFTPWTFPPTDFKITTHREMLNTYLYGQYAHAAEPHFRLSTAMNQTGISRGMATSDFFVTLKTVFTVVLFIADTLAMHSTSFKDAKQPELRE